MTPFNWFLVLLMAFGGVSLVARFSLGLGGSTHLSDTYPWGLWILFDLVWIAVAAGAFAMAAVIYVVAALLAVLGVTYNRMNVVLFAMTFRGRMPWVAAEGYAPSIVEWGISIGLIAATIFLFGLAARLMPVLSRAEPNEAHLSQ